MVKQGLKILRSLELNNHLRLAEIEFDEYIEDEDHRNKWAGLTNNPTLDTVTTWQQQNMPIRYLHAMTSSWSTENNLSKRV